MIFNYNSVHGCAIFSMSKFFTFLHTYYYLWGGILILVGIFLAFFGNKFVNAVIYIVTALAVFFIVAGLFFELAMKNVSKMWV